ncbi:GNAT family N-acetyltransferase [Shewanella cyperi]|uniref:GNAT family N-acetyltransferase n=1 Tax=Shewanella cyperi TaxID=2814292 RepID=A0A974XMY1_9GAMM|nr:GNAT family N-acetyltransferase [Shewanella cyperi]QSX31385.1 GNAT family N-acetyltransferase [Shewanella cyperi]QSX42173.1 GNAT family N-acetyltransferase [Shewanella cyperi]
MEPIITERLRLRELTAADAAFMLELLNTQGFITNIGDRGVRTLEQARQYLMDGPIASYAQNGFGLWLMERSLDGMALGLCGLIRRDTLPHVDIGYALLPAFEGQGYAFEAARAAMAFAVEQGIHPVVAIVNPDNQASIQLLLKLGLKYQHLITLPNIPHEVALYK